jgi:membrane protein
MPPGEHPIHQYWGFLAQGVKLVVNLVRQFYHRLDRFSGSRLSMIRRAFRRFSKNRGAESAASISFYTIFSIFPLLVFITSAASTFLDSKVVKESVLEWLTSMLPIVPEVILAEIQNLIDIRTTTVNLVALIGFLWSASGAFNALALSLNRVWHPVRPRSALLNRLFGLGMVASLVLLVIVLLMSSSVVTMIIGWGLAFGGRISLHLIPIVVRIIIFWLAYRLVPGGKVSSTSALLGACVASLTWDVTTLGFTAFIKRGFVRYEILYGSLGTIIALLFWVFLCCFIFLMGAYIAEADGYRKKEARLAANRG